MAGVAVVTDSTASLSGQQARRAGITVIPLQVVIDGASQPESNGAGQGHQVAVALRSGAAVSTSRPAPEAFSATYQGLAEGGATAVVSVHLSSKVSGTYDAALRAAQSAPVPVTVVDSQTLAMAAGFAALSGAAAAASGAGPDEVADRIRRRAGRSSTYFYVDTLEYLRRGGRIGAAQALLGSALAVKPLLTIVDGAITPCERVRTRAKALGRLRELADEAIDSSRGGERVDVAVHHLDDREGAEQLVDQLVDRASWLGDVVVCEVSAVLGAHVGPGTLGVVVAPRVR